MTRTVPPKAPDFVAPGLRFRTITEEIKLDTPAANFPLSQTLPAGAVVVAASLVLPATISATTATKVGLGRITASADPDKYLLSAALTAQDLAATQNFWGAPLAAAETVGIFACDNAGAAAGTIGGAGQKVLASLTYVIAEALN